MKYHKIDDKIFGITGGIRKDLDEQERKLLDYWLFLCISHSLAQPIEDLITVVYQAINQEMNDILELESIHDEP